MYLYCIKALGFHTGEMCLRAPQTQHDSELVQVSTIPDNLWSTETSCKSNLDVGLISNCTHSLYRLIINSFLVMIKGCVVICCYVELSLRLVPLSSSSKGILFVWFFSLRLHVSGNIELIPVLLLLIFGQKHCRRY